MIVEAEVRHVWLARAFGRAALGIALGSTMLVSFVPSLTDWAPGWSLLALCGVLGYPVAAVFAIAMLVARIERPLGPVTASVHDGALRVIGERSRYELPPEELVRGTVLRGGVSIEDVHGRELRVPMIAARARRLLDDLGLGAGNRRYEWRARVRSRVPGAALGVLAGLVLALVLGSAGAARWVCPMAAVGGVALGVLGEWMTRRWGWIRIVVGFDGVYASTPRGERAVRHADVARLEESPGTLRLTLTDGTIWDAPWNELDEATSEAVRTRVAEAYERAREHRTARQLPEPAPVQGAYRTADVPAERTRAAMREVLDSPLSADDARLVAARALASDPDDRARIALVAEAVASPKLRNALHAVARG